MEYILGLLTKVPDYVWQVIALLLPGNKIFRYIHGKLTAPVAMQ